MDRFYANFENSPCIFNPHILCTCTQEENFSVACEHCAWNPAEAERRNKEINGGNALHQNDQGLWQFSVPTYTKTNKTKEE